VGFAHKITPNFNPCVLCLLMRFRCQLWPHIASLPEFAFWMLTQFFIDRFHFVQHHKSSDDFCSDRCSMGGNRTFRGLFNTRYGLESRLSKESSWSQLDRERSLVMWHTACSSELQCSISPPQRGEGIGRACRGCISPLGLTFRGSRLKIRSGGRQVAPREDDLEVS